MCVTFVYVEHNSDARYKLILLNNRDEFLNRPTSIAKWENGILAGRDEREDARGTWLCMNAAGRISNLLTITVPKRQEKSNFATRGVLPVNFLKSDQKPEEFCKLLINTVEKYNAFQILCFQRNGHDQYEVAGLVYQPDDKVEVTSYPPGIYGFSNSPPCEPFKKVRRGIEKVESIVEEINKENLSEAEIIERLLQLATDKYQCFPDDQLKSRCGRSSEICKYRTAIFVKLPDGIPYGTRSHTIIIVDRNNRVTYYEKSMETEKRKMSEATWTEQIYHFDLI
uniref:Transport and Golgi organization protein 2 n=1 Tax=Setaria digitata TaxID=48799 RepID=A0A915PUR4_9BILA